MFFIEHKTGEFQLYTTLVALCRSENLGYSKFSKHFASLNWYRDEEVEIWRTEAVTNSSKCFS